MSPPARPSSALRPLLLALLLAGAPAFASTGSVTLQWQDQTLSELPETPETPVESDLWQRVRSGFKIEETPNPLIASQEANYASKPDYLARIAQRARRYLYYIVQEVETRSMPTELALLPIVESAFNPTAYSPSDASGIWQFIPATGRLYGLHQDDWYDGRRDFTAATRAALDYLGKLYLDFGDWQLALAAYNCGEGCVARAMQKNAEQGLPTDYASLPLPAETRNYVPKLMAIKHIVANPARYNVSLGDLPNTPYFDTVVVPPGINLDLPAAARLADVSPEEFKALNAAHSRGVIRTSVPVKVLVPAGSADRFQRELASGEWDKWEPYAAQRGERIADIAERNRTSIERLEKHNQLRLRNGRFTADQTILVPLTADAAPAQPVNVADSIRPSATTPRFHVVESGDTLFALARRYGVPLDTLLLANPGVGANLALGQQLRLPDSAQPAPAAVERVSYRPQAAPTVVEHTIEPGESLYRIARRYDVSVADLKRWNGDLGDMRSLRPGTRLTIRRD